MSVLFKVPPLEVDGDLVTLEARAYGAVQIARGDRVYLWWSETQGGAGLAGHGLCMQAVVVAKGWRATVEVVSDRFRGFGKADLASFLDLASTRPEATLAAKLYRHALNKVVAVTPAEGAFLDRLLAS